MFQRDSEVRPALDSTEKLHGHRFDFASQGPGIPGIVDLIEGNRQTPVARFHVSFDGFDTETPSRAAWNVTETNPLSGWPSRENEDSGGGGMTNFVEIDHRGRNKKIVTTASRYDFSRLIRKFCRDKLAAAD